MLASDDLWERTAAACALGEISGDAEPALPVLGSAWQGNPYTRGTITACLTEPGRAAAPAHDLLRTELATPRRHTARSGGHGSHDIVNDERLLRSCRAVLEAG
ncbi:hypothetical protein ACFS5L_18265 [Streptomyces phyllanthi]|uniref:HEAT repeat domain-containing protein n=1 Tax=Streptomyces phyllanthi TaxID=1803180 RepID=A0A5N8WDA3_9ACTN|nr:hypothetical protein [Streptomyces phyllanthi]MPY45397.1 hypothetical protein [Streptomyces phyllanthi]